MSDPITDYEGFVAWLNRGPERAPHLYGGKVAQKAAPEPWDAAEEVVEEGEAVHEAPQRPKTAPPLALLPGLDRKSAAAGDDEEETR